MDEPQAGGFPVVGIGASAGGITALQTLLQALPAHPRLALVIVQHMLPDPESGLFSLFRKWSAMRVHEVSDATTLERDCVYVAKSGYGLTIERGILVARAFGGTGARAGIDTIDSLFESMAHELDARAVGVVLSGTGADGAAGAVRIKQAGGVVLVQDPRTAMHDGMPSAAIATGTADHVLPLDGLADELVACAKPAYVRPASTWSDDVTRALEGIAELIRRSAGFDLSGYKVTPLLCRIQRQMEKRQVTRFEDYQALLLDDASEVQELLRGIPIHVTEFFRDEAAWIELRERAIRPLLSEASRGPIRAWSPACATGEEAYSLAMLLEEEVEASGHGCDFQVFATDASIEIIARASRGRFKPPRVAALSPERQQRFFYLADDSFRVKRSLRAKMVFAPQNLLADPPFTGLDLITCRNLLIYLEPDAARRVGYMLHSGLRMGGYLLLGRSETLPAERLGLELVSMSASLYRKVGPVAELEFDFPPGPTTLRGERSSRRVVESHAHIVEREHGDHPSVLVDDDLQLLRVYGNVRPFLGFVPGRPTLDVLKLTAPMVAAQVSRAVHKARLQKSGQKVEALADPRTGALRLSVHVTPFLTPDGGASTFLISFVRRSSPRSSDAIDAEAEVRATGGWSEALRVSREELEASREELMAVNEELRASNEQLNFSNAEVNEANRKLRGKLDELEVQSNVLSSSASMTLFLDREQRVRWFTAAIVELFPLRSTDVGRPITDIVKGFDDDSFMSDVCAVAQPNELREAEVCNRKGRWFLRRIRPYRTGGENAVSAGVAITFTDMTDRKRMEQALRRSEAALAVELEVTTQLHVFSAAANAARSVEELLELALDAATHVLSTDKGHIQLFDPRAGLLRLVAQRGFDAWFLDRFANIDAAGDSGFVRAVAHRESVSIEDVEVESPGDAYREVARRAGYRALHSAPLMTVAGGPLGIISTHFLQPRKLTHAERRLMDILANRLASGIERIRASQTLRDSERLLQQSQIWLAAQNEAFHSAMNGSPLEVSLGVLVRAARSRADGECRCAFYIADANGRSLRHVVGMPDAYAQCFEGVEISPQSFACGLAVSTGEPVITSDVLEEPRWQPWLWLAREYDYRACWSFPLATANGEVVGSFAMYFAQPCEPSVRDRELLATLSQTAAIIISRHPGSATSRS